MSENNIYQNQLNDINYSIDNNSKSKEITDSIINLNVEELNKTSIKKTENSIRQFNISPIIRKTPNSKADIIIQKIYTNRKNVIRNYQNTSSNSSSNILSNSYNQKDIYNLYKKDNSDISNNNSNVLLNLRNNDQFYNYDNNNDNNNIRISYINSNKNIDNQNNKDDINIITDVNSTLNNDDSPFSNNKLLKDRDNASKKLQDNSSSESSPDKSVTPSDDSVNSNIIPERNMEKRKRKYYRTIRYKKDNKITKMQSININEIETPKSSPSESPRDITQDLWNDLVENYYIEFQKLCKEEANKYKYLSHRNELISNILKFILLVSGCFTFTLSISVPNSLFMNTTTIVSSCLTAIITSITGFFQFDKKSEIQYNIYRELDKLYNTISLEMLKPTYMRPDPYEFILSLRNRKDELLKTLQKNN